jgi:two-component system, chemotaxis family, CheB/CheR fusion protein
MRVLIADDNRDLADSLSMLLTEEGHEVLTCYDGSACVDKARHWKPHVALIDITMPQTDGYSVGKAIRAMDFGQDVLLIAISGSGRPSDQQMSADAGFDVHLLKPFQPGAISQLISRGRPGHNTRLD